MDALSSDMHATNHLIGRKLSFECLSVSVKTITISILQNRIWKNQKDLHLYFYLISKESAFSSH
ncbi:hypothetical protein T07_6440 [Trichinella nelsoni]|uniref:Uncharacterized protein n=1 Tax=Trichinella nelsoni TaxID=6336 RepID=A0A0V0SM61_9BILA|nr:hypothetical protein T07_6440 [Trichinella nelsoni]